MQIAVFLTGAFAVLGGIHTFNRALIWALDSLAARHEWNVNIFSLLDGSESPQEGSSYMPSGRTRFTGFSGSRGRFAVAGTLAARQAHTTIIGHKNFLPLAPVLGRSRKLLIVHGIEVWRRLNLAERIGVREIATFLSVSDFTARRMAAANGLDSHRFVRFPNTLDPFYGLGQCTIPDRAALHLPSGPMLLSVSRLDRSERYKNIDLVIQAMPALLRKVPDAFYVVVGDGEDRSRLEQIARQASVAERVFFVGRVSDAHLPAYYQNSDLFVLPSTKEGFGIVFLEAMYYGKACIGAHAGGIPEVIQDGHTGLLVDVATPEHLAQAMIRVLSDNKVRCEFGCRGRERLQREFSREAFRKRLELALQV
jgi:phosphatidylinositol alpha-1,6-mannosyltransferase